MLALPGALAPLGKYPQFIIWEAVWNESKNKFEKKPINPVTGRPHSPLDSGSWFDAAQALEIARGRETYGVGFVFTEKDPFWFLDIDNCADGEDWSELAKQIIGYFPGAAIEVSQSGRGLHLFGTGTVPPHSCKNIPLQLEFYDRDRFVALTGTAAIGDAASDHSQMLAQVIPYYFPESQVVVSSDWTDEADPDWHGPEDDAELIKRMLGAKQSRDSVFGGGASVSDLWHANVDKLSTAYPDQSGNYGFDHSSADAALCQHLAFWTGKNCERIDRIFRQSALYRDKWERDDYRSNTVLRAVGLCKAVYSGKKADREPPSYTDADAVAPQPTQMTASYQVTYKEGLQYLAPSNQEELFSGCVYVRDIHRIYTPDGALLKQEQFKAVYGGYIFAIDSQNEKVTKNAWDAFTESQAIRFPKVHDICFRPELQPGSIVEDGGRVLVNCYVPVAVPSQPGDASPFLNHISRIIPDPGDQQILLAYMAACVQYKGTKFRWTPLIQGVEGNGKSMIGECLINAIGSKFIHKPNAQELGQGASKFTGWLRNKLLIAIEEVHCGGRRDFMDALKSPITDSRLEIQLKGVDQAMMDNRANFIMFSNYRDAVIKHRGDRRYCMFYTAQQTVEDLYAAGMMQADLQTPTRYFYDLFNWLENGGYAIVTHYLETYAIPDALNPATHCTRAPVTTSTHEAIMQSMGGVEQEVQEAIEQDQVGFAGGWVSSLALDRLLKARRDDKRIPHSKRRMLMQELGYVLHPGLPGGRSNNAIPLDGGKPRLYVKKDSIQAGITGVKSIVDAYVKAQGGEGVVAGPSAEIFAK